MWRLYGSNYALKLLEAAVMSENIGLSRTTQGSIQQPDAPSRARTPAHILRARMGRPYIKTSTLMYGTHLWTKAGTLPVPFAHSPSILAACAGQRQSALSDGTRLKEVYHDWVSSFRRTFDGARLHATTARQYWQQDETDYRFGNLDDGNYVQC